jgi:hypothetical protein
MKTIILLCLFPIVFIPNCISTLYLADHPSEFTNYVDGACRNYDKQKDTISVIFRGNISKGRYGMYKLSFIVDTSDIIYLDKRNIIFLGKYDSSICSIETVRKINCYPTYLSFDFIDSTNAIHTVIIGKKKEFNKSSLFILPLTVIGDIITSPIQLVGGVLALLYILFGGKTV